MFYSGRYSFQKQFAKIFAICNLQFCEFLKKNRIRENNQTYVFTVRLQTVAIIWALLSGRHQISLWTKKKNRKPSVANDIDSAQSCEANVEQTIANKTPNTNASEFTGRRYHQQFKQIKHPEHCPRRVVAVSPRRRTLCRRPSRTELRWLLSVVSLLIDSESAGERDRRAGGSGLWPRTCDYGSGFNFVRWWSERRAGRVVGHEPRAITPGRFSLGGDNRTLFRVVFPNCKSSSKCRFSLALRILLCVSICFVTPFQKAQVA